MAAAVAAVVALPAALWWFGQGQPDVGVCYDYGAQSIATAWDAEQVDCSEPHTAETFAVLESGGSATGRSYCQRRASQWFKAARKRSAAQPAVDAIFVATDPDDPTTGGRCDAIRWDGGAESRKFTRVKGSLKAALAGKPSSWADCRRNLAYSGATPCRSGNSGYVVFRASMRTPGNKPRGGSRECRKTAAADVGGTNTFSYILPTPSEWKRSDSWPVTCFFRLKDWKFADR